MDSISHTEYQTTLPLLSEMPKKPTCIYVRGNLPHQATTVAEALNGNGYIYLTVVGSRKATSYGKRICTDLIAGLRDLPVVIVSGLAIGIDSIAHRSALEHGMRTIAIPGSGIDDVSIYPAMHSSLAHDILTHDGALVSPFPEKTRGAPWTFPVRNEIMAGISHATLVIEANLQSGTLITSKHATDLSRDVFAVPGSIFERERAGPHQLIKLGATPICSPQDLREALGFHSEIPKTQHVSKEEQDILNILTQPKTIDEIISILGTPAEHVMVCISSLEIKGVLVRIGDRLSIN